jgi:hypothetical protein
MKLDDSKSKRFYVGYNLPITQADDLLVLRDPSKAYSPCYYVTTITLHNYLISEIYTNKYLIVLQVLLVFYFI